MTDRPVDGRGTAPAAGLPDGTPDDGTVPVPEIAFDALAGSSDWPDGTARFWGLVHTLPAMLRFRMFAIACGYEDADDCDALRADPLFKLAIGRAPESGRDLCSQPTMSRLENAPSRVEVARMTAALVDLFCRSFPTPAGVGSFRSGRPGPDGGGQSPPGTGSA